MNNPAKPMLSVDDCHFKTCKFNGFSLFGIHKKFKSCFHSLPDAKHRVLHRRIHSEPVFHVPNNPDHFANVTSSVLLHEISLNENFASASYSCEYGSSYGSRTNSFLSIEQSLPPESKRQSISSKITLIDGEENQFYQSSKFPTDSNTTRM